MLWLATAIGAACGFVGMNLSYQLDVQSGPTIVLVGAALFALVFAARAQLSVASAMRQRWISVRSSNPSRA
jgi:manganese/iron transport system permease protein/iron/zinc/copper transport system permease protein